MTVTENPNQSILVAGNYVSTQGVNTSFTLSGSQVGNLLVLSGYINGQMTQLYLQRDTGYAPTHDGGGIAFLHDANGNRVFGGEIYWK